MAAALKNLPDVKHLKIEDGKGRPLGRSFHVKLWPTYVLLRDGQILKQLIRPSAKELQQALQSFAAPPQSQSA